MNKSPLLIFSEEDLHRTIFDAVNAAFKKHNKGESKYIPNPLMTIKEVCAFFNVSSSTIHCWRKEGRLKAYYKGRRVYFKRSEVEESLVQPSN